jgi:hypothetical protein
MRPSVISWVDSQPVFSIFTGNPRDNRRPGDRSQSLAGAGRCWKSRVRSPATSQRRRRRQHPDTQNDHHSAKLDRGTDRVEYVRGQRVSAACPSSGSRSVHNGHSGRLPTGTAARQMRSVTGASSTTGVAVQRLGIRRVFTIHQRVRRCGVNSTIKPVKSNQLSENFRR